MVEVIREPLTIILLRSLYVSATAALIAFLLGLIISIAMLRLPRRFSTYILGVFDALVGVPTTAVALAVYMLIYPGGPLGFLNLLYTPTAIVIGQFLVVLPLTVTYLYRFLEHISTDIMELVSSLGAPRYRAYVLMLRESPPALLSIYLIAFARAVGELGVALILGGGIEGLTNVMTTAIALYVSLGLYEPALTLGGILVLVTVGISLLVRALGGLLWR